MTKAEYKQMQQNKRLASGYVAAPPRLNITIIMWLESMDYKIIEDDPINEVIVLYDKEFKTTYTLTYDNIIKRFQACKKDLIQ